MKLSSQTIAGFAVGAVITLGVAVLLLPQETKPIYGSARIDGNALKTMYNSDFKSLVLSFKYVSATNRFDLEPSISNAAGAQVTIDRLLFSVLTTGRTFAGDRTLVPYTLEHNRVSGLLQLQTLVGIVNSNPGCYFVLNADDYVTIDPRDVTHIYYRIVPFNSRGVAIDINGIDARVFQLNPSPPGRYY